MKKLFAIMLCALLAVCAVVPSFAATEISSTTMTDPFVEADVVTINFVDCVDDQPQLFNNKDHWAEKNQPNYEVPGFNADDRGFITLWGGTNAEKNIAVWAELPTFQVKFDAPAAGDYSFAFTMGGTQKGSYYVPVRVDDGDWYNVAFSTSGWNTPNTYYGMDNIHLEAGEHVFHFSYPAGCMDTQYYWSMSYTYTADEASEDTSAEDTSADAGEDTTASQGGEQTAPATFDVAVIALAVAGASAAVAVVSKKRR